MIVQTQDAEEIKNFITPDLFYEVGADDMSYEEFEPNFRLGYLMQKMEDFEGLWILERRSGVILCVHPAIPKKFRGRLVNKAAKEFYSYIIENMDFEKLVSETPVIYRHIKLFALQQGLRVEGLLTKSFEKDGELHDQWIMGISRQEITERLARE